jgi:surfactin synthase thioesterase subunit
VEPVAMRWFGLRPSDRLVLDRVSQAAQEAGRRYRPPAVDVAVTLYLGRDDSERLRDMFVDAWREVARNGLRVTLVQGSHEGNEVLQEPAVTDLAADVTAELAQRDLTRRR